MGSEAEGIELKISENGSNGTKETKCTSMGEAHPPRKDSFVTRFGGIFMAISASSFFSVCILSIKVLSKEYGYPPNGIAVLFSLGVLLPWIPAMVGENLNYCGH